MISTNSVHMTKVDVEVEDSGSAIRTNAERISIEPDKHSRLVFLTDPCGLAVERYKLLRSRLLGMAPQGGLIMVTSPSSGDGKTLTSTNLAWALAEGGHQTCLVDLDLRAPGLGYALGREIPADDSGLVEVLVGTSTVSRAIRRVGTGSLYILGIKDAQQTPGDSLAPDTLRPMLNTLRDTFAWVILDMPPAIPMSDVSEVLPHVDGALMIVRSGKTSSRLIEPTVEILGNKFWGVVLNDSLINGSAYYGYYGYGKDRKRKD